MYHACHAVTVVDGFKFFALYEEISICDELPRLRKEQDRNCRIADDSRKIVKIKARRRLRLRLTQTVKARCV